MMSSRPVLPDETGFCYHGDSLYCELSDVRDIAARLNNLIGGELKGYTELLTESRREAVSRMMAQAEALGANAVLNVRFSTSAVTAGASEMMAYGTAAVVAAET